MNFQQQPKTLRGDKAELYCLQIIRQYNPNVIIVTATTEQNRREHWDYRIITKRHPKGITIDVKAEKYCGHSGNSYTILEIFDVAGKLGWLYGEADYIAFQSGCSFVFTRRSDLISYHLQHTEDIVVEQLKDAVNRLYQRPGARDLITVVHFDELLPFSTHIKVKN